MSYTTLVRLSRNFFFKPLVLYHISWWAIKATDSVKNRYTPKDQINTNTTGLKHEWLAIQILPMEQSTEVEVVAG